MPLSPTKSTKVDTSENLTRWWCGKQLVIGVSIAISLLGMSYADAAKLPAGYSCMDIRSKVSEYGTIVLISMAKSRGFSDRDILTVRKECKV